MIETTEKPTAIFTGDWHLTEKKPVCRIDNYWDVRWRKVNFIKELQKIHRCPLIDTGDMFDSWKASPFLLTETIKQLSGFEYDIFTIPGNHDLKNHSMDLYDHSSLSVLDVSGCLYPFNEYESPDLKLHIVGFPWNVPPVPYDKAVKRRMRGAWRIAVIHTMVCYPGEEIPTVTSVSPQALLKKLKGFDLVATGHNHRTFSYTDTATGRILVNPGSVMRMDADQVDHRPSVYLWFAEERKLRRVYLPVEQGVISREHIEIKKKRDDRMNSFVAKMESGGTVKGLDFIKNLEDYMKQHRINRNVQKIIWGCCDAVVD